MKPVQLFWSLLLVLMIKTTAVNVLGKKSKFVEGSMYGLELSVDYFMFSKHRKEIERLYIVCDCSQAIEICVDGLSQYKT